MSMSAVWKQGYGRAAKTPPDERGGNRHPQPNVTAPHLDPTDPGRPECANSGLSTTDFRGRHAALRGRNSDRLSRGYVGRPPRARESIARALTRQREASYFIEVVPERNKAGANSGPNFRG